MGGMIELRSLTRRFGPILAVDGVSFSVDPGEVVGFLGPNGAGKSTTMKMVAGFLRPTSGRAMVGGSDVVTDPIAVKSRLGYLPEGAPAYPDMTPAGFLRFVAGSRGLKGPKLAAAVQAAATRTDLLGVMRQPIDTLSKGFKRRVGLAQAILHDPEALIMDEPTDGLDPNQKHHVRGLIREMSARRAIVLSTHILEEVEAVCTRAIIIARGRVVFDGPPDRLLARSAHHNAVTITVRHQPAETVRKALADLPGVAAVDPGPGSSFVALPKSGQPILPEIGRLARARAWEVDEVSVSRGRLDEVFRDLTGGAA